MKRVKQKPNRRNKGKDKKDRSHMAMIDYEYDPITGELKEEDMDLSGDKVCQGRCEYHDEPCIVVLEYHDERINNMVKHLHSIAGTEAHTKESRHYCELCQAATREGLSKSVFYRNPENGVIYKDKPRKVSYAEFYGDED